LGKHFIDREILEAGGGSEVAFHDPAHVVQVLDVIGLVEIVMLLDVLEDLRRHVLLGTEGSPRRHANDDEGKRDDDKDGRNEAEEAPYHESGHRCPLSIGFVATAR